MGKRGPKPSSADKLEVMSTRITTPTREALEKAAVENNRTFSSEVEKRLARSFKEDKEIVDHLGGREMYALLRTIAAAMNLAGELALRYRPDKKLAGYSWLDEPYAFDQAVKAISSVLEAFRPEGDTAPPTPIMVRSDKSIPEDVLAQMNAVHHHLGEYGAAEFLASVEKEDPSAPPTKRPLPAKQQLARTIASNLGHLHNRLKKGKKT